MAIKVQKDIVDVETELNQKLEAIGLSLSVIDEDEDEKTDEEIDESDVQFKVLNMDDVDTVLSASQEDDEEDEDDE